MNERSDPRSDKTRSVALRRGLRNSSRIRVRIKALFALEQIPAEAANKTPLASWWIAHVITTCWCVAFVALAGWRLNRWEE